MKKILMVWLLVTVIALLPLTTVSATQITQTVTVTATGEYIEISNAPGTRTLMSGGVLSLDTTYWSIYGNTTAANDPLDDATSYFTLDNSASNVDVDVTIGMSDMTGGTQWTNSDDGTNGADIFGMKAGASGVAQASMVVAKETGPYDTLTSSLGQTTIKWEFWLLSPTSMSDGVAKSGTITLTAVAS